MSGSVSTLSVRFEHGGRRLGDVKRGSAIIVGMSRYRLPRVCAASLVPILFLVIVTSCSSPKAIAPEASWPRFTTGELIVRSWLFVGPFDLPPELDSATSAWTGHDFLKSGGCAESDPQWYAVCSFKANSAASPRIVHAQVDESQTVNLASLFPSPTPAVAYGVTKVLSATDSSAFLLVGSGDGVRIFVNGAAVLRRTGLRGLDEYSDAVPVHLRRGVNVVTIKVRLSDPDSRVSVRLADRDFLWTTVLPKSPSSVSPFRSLLVHTGGDLLLVPEIVPPGLQIKLLDLGGRQVDAWICNSSLSARYSLAHLGIGEYTAQISFQGNQVLSLPLFYGPSPEEMQHNYESLLHTLAAHADDSDALRASLDTAGLLHRYKHLLKPENEELAEAGWQRRMLLVIRDLEQIRLHFQGGRDLAVPTDGFHLNAYRSDIDGSVQNYLIYIPQNRPNTPLRLIIEVPFTTRPVRSFLESVYLAQIENLERTARLAEQFGMAVVWFNGRGETVGADIEMSDFVEMLTDLKSRYQVDADRVYAIGGCTGAQEALRIAFRFPDVFAALAFLGPLTGPGPLATDDAISMPRDYYSGLWQNFNNPRAFTANLRNTPMFLLRAEGDKHTTLSDSLDFIKQCEREGYAPQLQILKGATERYYPDGDPNRLLFQFLSVQKRQTPSHLTLVAARLRYAGAFGLHIRQIADQSSLARIDADRQKGAWRVIGERNVQPPAMPRARHCHGSPCVPSNSKSSSIEGPIMHAFAGPFLVVRPTHGPLSQLQQWNAVVDRLSAAWRSAYFCDLRVREDAQLTVLDAKRYHLILIGTLQTNSVLRKLWAYFPVTWSNNNVVFFGRKYDLDKFTLEFVYPNPEAQNRYVVVLSGTDPSLYSNRNLLLSQTGWYDFSVWRASRVHATKLVDAGWFNNNWLLDHDRE
jgi:hypothetical protein